MPRLEIRTAQLASSVRSILLSAVAGGSPLEGPSVARRSTVRIGMTSYPKRLASAAHAIESILFTRRLRPDALTLVLAEDEFNGSKRLPDRLRRLTEVSGVEVLWVAESSRCYMKLLPVMAAHPDDAIVTADDDVLYPRWWLERLVDFHSQRPNVILGHRGSFIMRSGDREVAPYVTWPRADTRTPSPRVFLTGVGGVLYPPGSLPVEAWNMDLVRMLCPTNDDIWFQAMALMKGTHRPLQINDRRLDFPPTFRTGNRAGLAAANVVRGDNDIQFEAVYNHFDLWQHL